jgi:hypothetical protein
MKNDTTEEKEQDKTTEDSENFLNEVMNMEVIEEINLGNIKIIQIRITRDEVMDKLKL